jgi:hypothetical protein
MMKLIELPHKICDYTCMVNGLEDLYEAHRGNRLTDWFFFYMSGMAGFAYIKNRRASAPYMVNWGTRIRDQYANLAQAVGFAYDMYESKSSAAALKQAKTCIDAGQAVILGALDMFHLPYYSKFYHRFHVPYHYVLMVGYDNDRQVVMVQDCGRANVEVVSYNDLQNAWNVRVPGISGPNTLFRFHWEDKMPDEKEIAKKSLARHAAFMLHPPMKMLGIAGMEKLARELPLWPQKLNGEGLNASLHWLVEFTGCPPMLPGRLLGDPNAQDEHSGARKGFAELLQTLAGHYQEPIWAEVAEKIAHSGECIAQMTEAVTDHILGVRSGLEDAAQRTAEAAQWETQAYFVLLKACQI